MKIPVFLILARINIVMNPFYKICVVYEIMDKKVYFRSNKVETTVLSNIILILLLLSELIFFVK